MDASCICLPKINKRYHYLSTLCCESSLHFTKFHAIWSVQHTYKYYVFYAALYSVSLRLMIRVQIDKDIYLYIHIFRCITLLKIIRRLVNGRTILKSRCRKMHRMSVYKMIPSFIIFLPRIFSSYSIRSLILRIFIYSLYSIFVVSQYRYCFRNESTMCHYRLKSRKRLLMIHHSCDSYDKALVL